MNPPHADRVALAIRALWVVAVAGLVGLAAWSIRLFGASLGPTAAGLVGVASGFVLHPLAVAVNFGLSRRHGDAFAEGGRPTAAEWGAIYVREVFASARGLWFATPFLLHRPAPRPSTIDPRAPIVLFVHGFFCNRAIWRSTLRDVAARGWLADAITLPFQFGPIESNAPAIASAIGTLLAEARRAGSTATRAVLVGHSMGGLAIRAALPTIDRDRIARIVTIGTPHHGTWTARHGIFPNVRQMRVGSAFLDGLDRATDRAARANTLALYSRCDNIVFPQRTAALDGAMNAAVERVGHVTLVYDAGIRERLLSCIEEAIVAPP